MCYRLQTRLIFINRTSKGTASAVSISILCVQAVPFTSSVKKSGLQLVRGPDSSQPVVTAPSWNRSKSIYDSIYTLPGQRYTRVAL